MNNNDETSYQIPCAKGEALLGDMARLRGDVDDVLTAFGIHIQDLRMLWTEAIGEIARLRAEVERLTAEVERLRGGK